MVGESIVPRLHFFSLVFSFSLPFSLPYLLFLQFGECYDSERSPCSIKLRKTEDMCDLTLITHSAKNNLIG